jgi:hypothetical protein
MCGSHAQLSLVAVLLTQGNYIFVLTQEILQAHEKAMAKQPIRIDPSAIHWTPIDWTKRGKW